MSARPGLAEAIRQRADRAERDADRLGVSGADAASASERLAKDGPLLAAYLRRLAQELRQGLTDAGEDVTAVERGRR
jgi:hypothetical protein